MTREEEEEVRSLLERHQDRIMADLAGTDLLAVLVKNSVLTQSEEDLLLKSYPQALPSSAPSSVGVTKRKLSTMTSTGSGSSNGGGGGGGVGGGVGGVSGNGDYSSSLAGSSANNSRSASVNGDVINQSDNRSITPSISVVGVGVGAVVGDGDGGTTESIGEKSDFCKTNADDDIHSINDADILRMQCSNLIEIISKSGFQKFKQFCYAIENECPQLIEDLINDRLKCDTTTISSNEEKIQKEIETIDYIDKEKENDRNRRAVSYGGGLTPSTPTNVTLPRAAPRRMGMKEPPPPPPPKPALSQKSIQSTPTSTTTSTASPILSKYPQSEYNLIQKVDSNSTLTAPAQYQAQNFYANTSTISSSGNNYSSLLCHASSTASPLAVRKRDKLLHRFSDAATLGRKLKKKKNTNRACRSMTDTIEFLADPVIEDEFFGDRTTWEYHTVAVTRVPGYGFGIAVSGGRDNPHFANGDPSIAVSDVLKGGPAEDRLQVNDRIISVNGVSLENVEYATAVQVLRDSGNTVTLVVKRRVPLNSAVTSSAQHQHSLSMNSIGYNANSNGLANQTPVIAGLTGMSQPSSLNSSMIQQNTPGQPIKVTLSKSNKKDDYGIVLGCRLFIKEISTKTRDQLTANGYSLQEGDVITRIHNTNCADTMSLKEAKKIIDGCKERLNLVVLRDITNQVAPAMTNQLNNSNVQFAGHQAQVSGCSNNLDDPYLTGGTSYSSQNLYVQPPTRSTSNGPSNGGLHEEKSNLTPRGRSRGPIMDGVSLSQLDRPASPPNGPNPRLRSDEPPRPPPPRGSSVGNNEDFYSSRRQLYEDDPIARSRQSSEPRFISFQKEGSVGIRLTGGNEAGIFVTAVQPGSPASLQGLTPGDKILKVNDMDMHGVTREEAVLFLLSLQDRIDLIVQYCKEDYDEVVTNQRGDSFHIKTHFHCDNPSKGEMAFKAGDVFRVIDTLHNGVVGSWQVLKIGRGHQEMQRGVIPNKARAEELATAQFNATKKEMNANESRGNFFRRRRSTHRRSKSLNRENWDDVVFSDSISKFPAYERVVLRHPGFVRPVVLFGPVSDLAREKLAKDFPDKFSTPLQDDDKSNSKCRIVRLSNIRDVMERGKHALLDITPNAVDRLNYAQFYPIVIFLKTDSKHVIKQLRHGLPKAAHKSSKKLLEQCQKLDRVWSHIFSTQIVLNDEESWYRKLRDAIDLQQSGAVWMSESKPVESLSDDFLFPMTTSRLSYASSPESDLELSPGPSTSLSLGNLPQLIKSSSDPSIATNQDNLDRDRDIIGEGLPPPYTVPYEHSSNQPTNRRQTMDSSKYPPYTTNGQTNIPSNSSNNAVIDPTNPNLRPQSLYGINAPDLPPRIDRQSKPGPGEIQSQKPASRTNSTGGGTLGRSAQERLFGKPIVNDDVQAEYITRNAINNDTIERQQASLERQARINAAMGSPVTNKNGTSSMPQQQNGSYDSVSSYDSYNTSQLTMQNLGRLGPNAPDDLKSVPNANAGRPLPPIGMGTQAADYARSSHDHRNFIVANDLNRQSSPGRPQYNDMHAGRNIDQRNIQPQRPSNLGLDSSPRKQVVETKTDYGKYSRNNSASQADYNKLPKNPHMAVPPTNVNGTPNGNSGPGGPFKPVPPPKPKNYRPPIQGGNQWENGEPGSPRSPNDFYYSHHYSQQTPGSPQHGVNNNMQPTYGTNSNYSQQPHQYPPAANGYNSSSHHYNGGSGTGVPYIAPHRGIQPPIGNLPPHAPERHALDLAGSREQRGSAFELYRKPQIGTVAGHHHNMSDMEPYDPRYDDYYSMTPQPPPPDHYRSRSAPRYPNEPPPNAQDHNYYSYQRPQKHPQEQYYDNDKILMPPPPLPPHKPKKKSMLKSPLTAIKNALIKTTRPLRRMNSMVEPEKKPTKSSLRRQHSLLERGMQRPCYPDEYPTYPAGMDDRYFEHSQRNHQFDSREQYYRQQEQRYDRRRQYYNPQDVMNSTYRNLETEDIYGNLGTVPRVGARGHFDRYDSYDQDDLYANRALIDLERRQAEAATHRNGRRIIRRHSTTTADRANGRRPFVQSNGMSPDYDQDDIYQSKQGAYMLDNAQRRAPNSEVMARRRFYPGAANEMGDMPAESVYQSRREIQREMQRHHLQQSKKEMQERIMQGKKEIQREFSPHSGSSQSERSDDKSERDSGYHARRDFKDGGGALKTRSQLMEQIYQTRRESLDSMAEPAYVSKRDIGRPEPIYETKEESLMHSRENETDEKKEEEKTDVTIAEINHEDDTLSRSDLQKSSDTVIENTSIIQANLEDDPSMQNNGKAPLVQCEDVDDESIIAGTDETTIDKTNDADLSEQPTAIENLTHNRGMLNDLTINETQELSDEVFEMPKKTSQIVEGPPIEALAPPKPTKPITPRSNRAPFHISNILKRTAPPPGPPTAMSDSRTSIETQYTSQGSLPVGPPNATSTPYTSNMSLPVAGPVPTSAPAVASLPGVGPFPPLPREPTTTRGIFDSNGGTLCDNAWNVSLQIPPGAIPEGIRQEVYFTVSDPRMGEAVGGPPLDMENGETMLSPLVMCGPQGLEFLVPVTLNIPHCAGRTASLGLALKATDSEKNLHTEWDNIDLPSNAAAHTVSVKVDHF